MDSKRWTSLNTILDRALELPPEERIPFISSYDELSDDIRRDAISFLESIDKSDDLWDRLMVSNHELIEDMDRTGGSSFNDTLPPPEKAGPYKILEKIASGGMGNVYLAERADGHLQLTVALKIIRRECIDENHIHQFKLERNILARLNHPNIARIYDGGITENGRPFLAMEYVEGQSVTTYCKTNGCGLDKKLDLFEQICRAVNFAHSNLIVHRDLKPDNIFVTNSGTCKILDFGIAKIIDPEGVLAESDSASVSTSNLDELKPFSIQHAAPEQLSGESITTATDVYALGLLLYELLTGTLPYNLQKKTPVEAISIIRKSPLPVASLKIADPKIARRVRDDLDDIIHKTLQKNPADRYQSAGDLLADIQHFRNRNPVSFKQDNHLYRLKKFSARNSGPLIATAVILVLLSFMSFHYIDTINAERQKAMSEEQQASFIANFMVDLFDASDPVDNISDTLTVYNLLQSGVNKLESWEGSDLSKADITLSLGKAYRKIGDYDRAESLFEEAYSTYIGSIGDTLSPDMLEPTLQLAEFYKDQRNYVYSSHFYHRSLTIFKQTPDLEESLESRIYSGYGNTLSNLGNSVLGGIYLQSSLDLAESLDLPATRIRTIQTNLAQVYRTNEEYQKSETLYRELLRTLPADERNSIEGAVIHNNLAFLLKVQDRFQEALVHYTQALEKNNFVYGEQHPNSLIILNNIAALHMAMNNYEESVNIRRDLIDITTREYGATHWRTGSAYEAFGILKLEAKQIDESSTYFGKSVEIYTENLGSDHIWTNRSRLYHALSQINSDDSARAKEQFERALNALSEQRPHFSRYDVDVMNKLIERFSEYPSISSTQEFARLAAIR